MEERYCALNAFRCPFVIASFCDTPYLFSKPCKPPENRLLIVKTNGKELPDSVYEEAAALAAYYSKGRQAPKVEIDYTLKKNLRKPNGSKPGFVVYYTNYSMMAEPNIRNLQEVQD